MQQRNITVRYSSIDGHSKTRRLRPWQVPRPRPRPSSAQQRGSRRCQEIPHDAP